MSAGGARDVRPARGRRGAGRDRVANRRRGAQGGRRGGTQTARAHGHGGTRARGPDSARVGGVNRGFLGFVVGVVVLLAVAAAVASSSGGGGGGAGDNGAGVAVQEIRDVEVTSVGATGVAPALVGSSFDGSRVAITNDGTPKLVMFLAHWCPHCRAEVPVVTEWLRAGDLPEDVSLYAVSTSVDKARPNYPPSAWLDREAFPVPTLADDADSSAAAAFGVDGFPYFVAIASDGRVVERDSGELPVARLVGLLDKARAG